MILTYFKKINLRTVLFLIGLCIITPFLILALARAIAMTDANHNSLFFLGFSYIPPFWILILGMLSSFLSWFCTLRVLPVFTIGISFLVYLVDGDHRLISKIFEEQQVIAFDHTEDDLSVLALNTQCYQQGVDRIGAFIHASNSDVVLLSENHTSKEKTLRDVLPANWQLHGSDNETAIATRLPVVSFQLVELPTKEISLTKHNHLEALKKGLSRKFAHAVVLYQNQPIHVISLRFIAGRGPSYEPLDQLTWGIHLLKEQQAELKFVMNYLSNLRGPVIFGGDLNAPPGSFPIKRLSERFHDSRFASHTFGGFTFRNTVLPTLRLDYIYHSKDFVTKSLDIMKVKVSDHYPVIGKFYLKDPDISLRLGHHKKNSI